MNKWEETLKQKIYLSKIKAAKSIVSKTANERHSQKSVNLSSNHIIRPEDVSKQQGLKAALRLHGLQQYERGFSERGYLDSPEKLKGLIQPDRLQALTSEMKMLPGHLTKLGNMLKAFENESTQVKLPAIRRIPISRVEISSQQTIAKRIIDLPQQMTERKHLKPVLVGRPSEGKDKYRGIGQSLNLVTSSSKSLRPGIKKAIVRLNSMNKKETIQVKLDYADEECGYRSIDGARMMSSLVRPQLSELVDCLSSYIISRMVIIPGRNRKRPCITIDDGLFNRVKQRRNSFDSLVRNTQDISTNFSVFDDFNQQLPSVSSVSNYLRNVITSCKFKLEQLPVVVCYFNKLLKDKMSLTNNNIRLLLLTVLLLAHKVYDDDSLHTRSGCSKFVQTSTLLELERTVLVALDYQLNVTPQEYANGYFQLRNHVKKDATTHKNIRAQRCHLAEYVSLAAMLSLNRKEASAASRKRRKSF